MQNTEKDQFIHRADRVIFARVEYKERVRSAGMFDTVAAREDALSLQCYHEERRTRRVMFADGLPRLEREQDCASFTVNMKRLGARVFLAELYFFEQVCNFHVHSFLALSE